MQLELIMPFTITYIEAIPFKNKLSMIKSTCVRRPLLSLFHTVSIRQRARVRARGRPRGRVRGRGRERVLVHVRAGVSTSVLCDVRVRERVRMHVRTYVRMYVCINVGHIMNERVRARC